MRHTVLNATGQKAASEAVSRRSRQANFFDSLPQLMVKTSSCQMLPRMSSREHPLLIIGWIYNQFPSIELFIKQWMKWDRLCLGFSFCDWCYQDNRAGSDVPPTQCETLADSGTSASEQRSQDSMWNKQMIVQRIELSSGQDPRSIEVIDLHL